MSAAKDPPPAPSLSGEEKNTSAVAAPGAKAASTPPRKRRAGRLLLVAVALVVGVLGYFAFWPSEPKTDFGRFQGTWRLAPSGRENRFPVTVRVSGDQWVYVVGEQEQKKYRLELRPEANPKEIDLTQLGPDDRPSAFVLKGIYAFEDGSVKVVTAPGTLPRPTDFDASDAPVWVLERP